MPGKRVVRVALPEELYQRLVAYASARRVRLEDVLEEAVARLLAGKPFKAGVAGRGAQVKDWSGVRRRLQRSPRLSSWRLSSLDYS